MISIVVPIYNGEKYIKKCIKSIVAQDYENWEVILVDDGSKDNSRTICNHLAKVDSRIRVVEQENQGPMMARRVGVLEAKGEYLTFLDVDDTFCNKELLSTIEKVLDNTHADIIQFGNYHTYFYGLIKRKKTKKYVELDKRKIAEEAYVDLFGGEHKYITPTVWGKVYPTKKLQNILCNVDIRISMGEDLYINNLYFEKYFPDKFINLDYVGINHGIGIGISVDKANKMWLDFVKLKKLQQEIIRRNSLSDKFAYATYVEYLYLLFYTAVQIYEVNYDIQQLQEWVENAFEEQSVKDAKAFLKNTTYAKWKEMDDFCNLKVEEYCLTIIKHVRNYTIKDKIKKVLRKILYR